MECWGLSKRSSWLYWLLMLTMIHLLMVGQTQGDCVEEERNALLEMKTSHIKSFDSKNDHFLPTWVDYGSSTPGDGGGDCWYWERVSCNTTTGHVTDLSLYDLSGSDLHLHSHWGDKSKLWALNVSLFLHFKELKSLSLSANFLDKEIMIKTELSHLTNLEELDLSYNYLYDTASIQGVERGSILRKLKTLNLRSNGFSESVITSLSTLSSLTKLDLTHNHLSGRFPAEELSHLTNLEELDLSWNRLNDTPSIQVCKSLSRLRRLESIYLSWNSFNRSIISCLSALPSLKTLHLSHSFSWGSSFPVQEFHNLLDLEVLYLSYNGFSGTLPMEAFTSFHHLRVLDLSHNNFVGSVPSAIKALSSLEALSLAYNQLNGSLSDHGLCELKNLQELDLRGNILDGTLPQCFNSLSSLKLLDISSNQFTGILPPSLFANLTSLEYVDFSHNNFEGSFSFNSFSNHSKLEFVAFESDNDKFEVETEEPIGWIPVFQLHILVLSNCNMNKHKGHVVPGFLLHQHKLQYVDMSHNCLKGQFPIWLIKHNMNLEVLKLRNNSLIGSMAPLYWNTNMKVLDMSGNQMTGSVPDDIPKFFPYLVQLDLSRNVLSGAIPSSIGDLSELRILDLSDNELSGELPLGLLRNISGLFILKLSKNKLYGEVLSGNVSFLNIERVHLDSNHFSGTIGIKNSENNFANLQTLDISNNFFTGMIPDWIGNMSVLSELVMRNNSFQGRFPCGAASFSFLDISQNSFSGPIPSCLNWQSMKHLHLGSNRFTGSMPTSFRNLTVVLTFDIANNKLSGRIPEFIGELSNLRILLLRKNNFGGSIPKQLCQLSNASLVDLSENFLSGSIPSCLQNISGPTDLAFLQTVMLGYDIPSTYTYKNRIVVPMLDSTDYIFDVLETRDEVQFTTKSMSRPYIGNMLDLMAGLDLSCNKLTGEIPKELGLLTRIHALNLSHNQLIGPIPVNFSNLANIESLDLSSNGLTGKVPSELSKLNFLGVFNISHNNLSGRLPEMKGQFGTFTKASYEGNPHLCGPPLEKKCTTEPLVTDPSSEEDNEKWYVVDMACFYGSSSSTCVVFLLGFVGLLYVNPCWRRRWLDLVEECIYRGYYFFYDSVRKLCMIFSK